MTYGHDEAMRDLDKAREYADFDSMLSVPTIDRLAAYIEELEAENAKLRKVVEAASTLRHHRTILPSAYEYGRDGWFERQQEIDEQIFAALAAMEGDTE